jgi:dTDP-glucose 4,6-dehydratase
MLPLPPEDLDHVLEHTRPLWEEMRGQRLFITGGTGFFGTWLLESLIAANRHYGIGASAVTLTRDPGGFASRAPHITGDPAVQLVCGSVATFNPIAVARDFAHFDAVIHLATEADLAAVLARPLDAIDVIAGGTRRALDLAERTGVRRFLLTSSGSVYARQAAGGKPIEESLAAAPDPTDMDQAYAIGGEAKRQAEALCAAWARQRGTAALIARCFTFVGPGMPMSGKFAIGNFIEDALAGRPITIQGDGTPVRSYLYAADLTIWLWTILLRGVSGRSYNVGSARTVTLRELARSVASVLGSAAGVRVLTAPDPAGPVDYYVPSTLRAQNELGLSESISLEEALRRTAAWRRT